MATITAKQIADRKITQTVFYPLALAVDLDKAAEEFGISRNKLINACTTLGLQDKEKLKEMLLEGGRRATNSNPHQPAYTNTASMPHGTNSQEAQVQ